MLTRMCKAFNALPDPGGILQQDPYLLRGMILVLDAADEAEELQRKKAKK